VAIAAGDEHSLLLIADGTVWAFGSANYGHLGNNQSSGYYDVPQQTYHTDGIRFLTHVIAIAAGLHHSLALLENGRVCAWGQGENGRLGNNMTMSQSLPVMVFDTSGINDLYRRGCN
jgi:Alpha-tubulin suppressor and related RCC1 domain-containing proteins